MDLVYFMVRHTPFWAVPLMIICAEFAYVYWLKNRTNIYRSFIFVFALSFISIVFYYVCGGPELAVSALKNFVIEYFYQN